jgi:hypothetical protein
MALASGPVAFTNSVSLGVNGPTSKLINRPTLIVSRSTAESPTKLISFAGNIAAVNFIAGCNAILQTATMNATAVYLFVNTQPGPVTLALDNGGTVGGQAIYILAFGAPVEFQFNGINLS